MQIKKYAVNQYNKALKIIVLFVLMFSFTGLFSSTNAVVVGADSNGQSSQATPAQIEAILNVSDCPETLKNTFAGLVASGVDIKSLTGTYYVATDEATGEIIGLTCGSTAKFQKLIIRLFVIIISLVGFVLAFGIGRSAIMMITAFDDQEKFQAAVKSLTTSISAIVGVFFGYILLVFLLVGVLGIGTTTGANKEWNIFCQNRIVFSLTFESGVDPCSKPA